MAAGGITPVVLEDGTALCWGGDEYGQAQAPDGLFFETIEASEHHSCGLTAEGEAVCWGISDGGGLDYGQVTLTPDDVRFESIRAGHMHNCGVTDEQTLFCWRDKYLPPSGVFRCGGGQSSVLRVGVDGR